jgi:hypothetical protein
MCFVTICFIVLFPIPATPSKSALLEGSWSINANGNWGLLVINLDDHDKIDGSMYGHSIKGTYDSKTKQVMIKRLVSSKKGKPSAVQVFTGTLAQDPKAKPPLYTLKGTFKSVGGPDWGKLDVKYKWTATTGSPTHAKALREWQGQWKVVTSRWARHLGQPFEAGSVVTVSGNEFLRNGKVVATLAADLHLSGAAKPHPSRRLLMLTLPDGKGVLCAYRINGDNLNVVYPYGVINLAVDMVNMKRVSKSDAKGDK